MSKSATTRLNVGFFYVEFIMNGFLDRMSDPDFRFQHRVRWIETNAVGTVHFCNYVCFMEEAEYAFLKSRGLNIVLSDERGQIGFPRVSSQIEILRPAEAFELLTIWLKVAGNDGVKLTYRFEITAEDHQLVARGEFVAACCRFVPGEFPRAILIPDFVLERIPERPLDPPGMR